MGIAISRVAGTVPVTKAIARSDDIVARLRTPLVPTYP